MIFQEPTTSLNPCFTIGWQLMETLAPAPAPRQARGEEARDRTARAGRHSGGLVAPRQLSAPAVRRHEPARDDRDGHRLQPAAADRRRADHRARRHHPGADPRPAAQPAEGARHGLGADHAQHGRGQRDGAARGRDVCGPGDGAARRRRALRGAAASLHRGAAGGAAGARGRRRPARDHRRAWCPACTTAPQAACSRRAAAMPPRIRAPCGPSCATGWAARCAATTRSATRIATRRCARDGAQVVEFVR